MESFPLSPPLLVISPLLPFSVWVRLWQKVSTCATRVGHATTNTTAGRIGWGALVAALDLAKDYPPFLAFHYSSETWSCFYSGPGIGPTLLARVRAISGGMGLAPLPGPVCREWIPCMAWLGTGLRSLCAMGRVPAFLTVF